ncbi:MAG TPA: chromosome segregation protein SMC, partial [Anaerolineaceae bacterium]
MAPRLKSLELHGYKTFASRTLFEFPGDITAIVGPNGSGKSNIADAMRWVLGEQSFTLLRGRKTEDMIFAGSEQRARAGMASASITFDNQDGWLPIDFTEVAITRRAYRDGNNEYLLNGQRVRLKEISELLAQSGLAERTYTIIGQGLVDAALSLKPEERRRFFEEAAGIGLYRGRREEALNRLETTRRNLERVQDILSELEPRLHSLERQARRVQEYERIKADLRLLLRDWYGYHWRANQKEIAHTLEVLHAQETRLDTARQHQGKIDAALAELRGRLQENRISLNAWHMQSAGLHTQREAISRKLAVLDERQRALHDQQQSLAGDLGRLEEEHTQRKDRLQQAQADQQHLQADLEEAEAQAQEASGNLNQRQRQRGQAEQEVRDSRRAVVAAETRQVQLKARLNELTHRREEQCASQTNLQQAVENGKTALQAAQERLRQAEARRSDASAAHAQAESSLQTAQRSLTELEGQRRKAIEDRSRREAERARTQAQLDVLEQAEKSLSGLNNGAKFVLQAARQGKLGGGYQALSNRLVVPREYEVAIAASLGEVLDGIVLDEKADLEGTLQMLESGEKGRAILFPLSSAADGRKISPPVDADCLGLACDLVQTTPDMEPVIHLLLGQVIVARTREAARRLVKQIPTSARVVTLRGEVFWGSGLVAAGQEGRSGVIGRPRQMNELRETLAAAESAVNAAQDLLQSVDKDLAARQEQARELDRAVKSAAQALAQASQAQQQAQLENEQVKQKLDWQASQLASLDGHLKRTDDEIKQSTAELAKVETQIGELQEQVREN